MLLGKLRKIRIYPGSSRIYISFLKEDDTLSYNSYLSLDTSRSFWKTFYYCIIQGRELKLMLEKNGRGYADLELSDTEIDFAKLFKNCEMIEGYEWRKYNKKMEEGKMTKEEAMEKLSLELLKEAIISLEEINGIRI